MVFLILLALPLLAAAAEPQRPVSFVPVTACSVISQMDVQQAVGRYVGKGTEETGKAETTCTFSGRTGLVSVTIHKIEQRPDFETEQRELRTALPSATFREAALGDATGFYMDLPQAGTQLHLVRGSTRHVMVSILGFGEAAEVSRAAESIARTILNRIGPS